MDPKMTIFFLLIAAVIAMSHQGSDSLRRLRLVRRWRAMMPSRRRS